MRCFWYFNSHACDFCKHKQANFNSHASCEVRQSIYRRQKTFLNFNSHASCEARLYAAQNAKNIIAFQLTRLLRGATNTGNGFADTLLISTHTPLARRDARKSVGVPKNQNFNSHASCEARPCVALRVAVGEDNFNSHASCEARLAAQNGTDIRRHFNSHASCEARHGGFIETLSSAVFQLTRLLRGATCINYLEIMARYISTHTPLARRDRKRFKRVKLIK